MERYEIIITEKGKKTESNVAGQEGSTTTTNVAGQDEKETKDAKTSKWAIAGMVGKAILNEAQTLIVPRIGEYTRDSLLQQQIDSAIGVASTAAAFAIHPIVGLVDLTNKTVSSALDFSIRQQKEQERLTVQMQRASYVNRSRD